MNKIIQSSDGRSSSHSRIMTMNDCLKFILESDHIGLAEKQKKCEYIVFLWIWKNALFCYHLHLHYNTDNLFVLIGISSVGKTTLLKTVQEKYPEIVTIECDDFGTNLNYDFLEKEATKTFKIAFQYFGKNLMHYIFCEKSEDRFWLRIGVDDRSYWLPYLNELKELILKNEGTFINIMPVNLIKKLHMHRYLGHKVLLDMYLNPHELNLIRQFKPKLVTVYRALPDLIEKVELRNRRAIKNNEANEWRHPLIVIRQFSETYVVKKTDEIAPGLGRLSEQEVILAMQDSLQKYPYNLPRSYVSNEQFKALIKANLHMKESSSATIYPGFWNSQKRIVNMSTMTIEQAAMQVIRIMK